MDGLTVDDRSKTERTFLSQDRPDVAYFYFDLGWVDFRFGYKGGKQAWVRFLRKGLRTLISKLLLVANRLKYFSNNDY